MFDAWKVELDFLGGRFNAAVVSGSCDVSTRLCSSFNIPSRSLTVRP